MPPTRLRAAAPGTPREAPREFLHLAAGFGCCSGASCKQALGAGAPSPRGGSTVRLRARSESARPALPRGREGCPRPGAPRRSPAGSALQLAPGGPLPGRAGRRRHTGRGPVPGARHPGPSGHQPRGKRRPGIPGAAQEAARRPRLPPPPHGEPGAEAGTAQGPGSRGAPHASPPRPPPPPPPPGLGPAGQPEPRTSAAPQPQPEPEPEPTRLPAARALTSSPGRAATPPAVTAAPLPGQRPRRMLFKGAAVAATPWLRPSLQRRRAELLPALAGEGSCLDFCNAPA
ncbi:proline-rich protein 2-like [Canis lupus familiaris]|uniref:proline-rich protein 2-like n=1 Tax=Canis lupus familiaris TaxID=9615 RepID=UPI0018F5974F|nr:proline-rich protein 2-like [Canis lupus familiaris]